MKKKDIKRLTKEAVDSAFGAEDGNFAVFEKNVNWENVALKARETRQTKRTPFWLKPAIITGATTLILGVGIGLPVGMTLAPLFSEPIYGGNEPKTVLKEGTYVLDDLPADTTTIPLSLNSTSVFSITSRANKKGTLFFPSYLGFSGVLSFADSGLEEASFTTAYRKEGDPGLYTEAIIADNTYSIKMVSHYTDTSGRISLTITGFDVDYFQIVEFKKK